VDAHHRPAEIGHSGKTSQILHEVGPIPSKSTSGPGDGLAGDITKTRCDLRSENGLLVITEDHDRSTLAKKVEACFRFGAVPDHVPKADQPIDPLHLEFEQHRFERVAIAMDVTEDSESHRIDSVAAQNRIMMRFDDSIPLILLHRSMTLSKSMIHVSDVFLES